MRLRHLPVGLAVALGIAGCATTPRYGADVTRFHLGQPIARGTVFIEPADPAQAQGLEFRQYAAAVAERLRAAGFQPVDRRTGAELVGVLGYAQTTRAGLEQSSPFSIGIGGGGFGGGRRSGVGVGGGVSIPLGKRRRNEVNVNLLTLTLRRISDSTTVWEGRAIGEARADTPYAGLGDSVPVLADALMRDFPGPSGQTTRYTPGA